MEQRFPVAREVAALAHLSQEYTQRALAQQLGRRPADRLDLRKGQVQSPVTSVSSYDVILTNDTVTRTLPSISPVGLAAGDWVWVLQVGPTYVLVGPVTAPVRQSGTEAVSFVAQSAKSVTFSYPIPYTGTPWLGHSVQVGSNFDVISNLQTVSNTGATVRLVQKDAGSFTGTATLYWEAVGV